VLPGISTEQLRSRLNRMVADGMLTRKRYREVPPRVDYELTDRARELMPILAELARWGYEWAWSPPRGSESVDFGAIFRLAPGLVDPAGASGTVEFSVDHQDGARRSYAFRISGDRLTMVERAAERADARVSGSEAAWIDALSPDHNRAALLVEGERGLAELVLDGLSARRPPEATRAVA